MVSIGIIGCGKIAQMRHIPEFARHPQARLAGFYDRTPERAREMARRYGGRVYPTWEALVADPALDAVSICTANFLHARQAVAALRAGKHVLCEKPMATTPEDCEAMVEAAREGGTFLMIAQNQRLSPVHQKARALIRQGVLGEILSFRTTFGHGGPETWSIRPGRDTWFFDPRQAAMGAMADLGVHKTDLIQYLTGQNVVEVTARTATLDKRDAQGRPIGVEDNAFCIYRLQGGALGTLTASWTFYGGEDNSTVLYGTRGVLHICDGPDGPLKLVSARGEVTRFPLAPIQTNACQTSSGVIDHFMDSLVCGTPPALSGQSVLPAMRAVFAALESARTGRTVAVPQD